MICPINHSENFIKSTVRRRGTKCVLSSFSFGHRKVVMSLKQKYAKLYPK